MRAVIPFDVRTPKKRLSDVLDPTERADFALAMLRDVIFATDSTDLEPTVLATGPLPDSVPAPVTIDERSLDAAVGAEIDAGTPVAVVMADLPLVRAETLDRLAKTAGDVVFAPGRSGGTNAMVVRSDSFTVDYHGVSIRDHREIARNEGLSVNEIDSFRLATDIDEPADLLEVLLHGTGRSSDWLRTGGFRVESTGGRATVTRTTTE